MSVAARRAANRLVVKYEGVPPIAVEDIAVREGAQIDYQDLDDDVSGLLVRRDDQAIIVVNVRHHPNRQRFTIAHELGHYVLHKDSPAVFVDNFLVHFREDRSTRRRYDPREQEANVFAANLLLPERFLRAELKGSPIDVSDEDAMHELARRFNVSPQALTIRLVKIGLAVGLPG